jgi:hypothetical protein
MRARIAILRKRRGVFPHGRGDGTQPGGLHLSRESDETNAERYRFVNQAAPLAEWRGSYLADGDGEREHDGSTIRDTSKYEIGWTLSVGLKFRVRSCACVLNLRSKAGFTAPTIFEAKPTFCCRSPQAQKMLLSTRPNGGRLARALLVRVTYSDGSAARETSRFVVLCADQYNLKFTSTFGLNKGG